MRINVTQMIVLPEFKTEIRNIIQKPKLPENKPTLLYPRMCSSWEASVVGTAYDYLIRYFLIDKYATLNPSCEWIWQTTARYFYDQNEIKEMQDILISNKLTTKKLETLIKIAGLDVVFRSGRTKYFNPDMKFTNNVTDLKQLAETLNILPFTPKKTLHLNPAFAVGDQINNNYVHGDVDLIIDDLLIDVKTTKDVKFDDKMWHQLVLYYFMLKFYGLEINKVGIYYSRFNYLFEIDIKNFVNDEQFKQIENLVFKITQAENKEL